jgi:hypothetical protein
VIDALADSEKPRPRSRVLCRAALLTILARVQHSWRAAVQRLPALETAEIGETSVIDRIQTLASGSMLVTGGENISTEGYKA